MNEFTLTQMFKDKSWKGRYKGVQHIEALIDEICETHGITPETEKHNIGSWALTEKRTMKTIVPETAALKGLWLMFTYSVPIGSSPEPMTLHALSPISGNVELKTEDPSVIISVLATLISAHDPDHGKWVNWHNPSPGK